MIRNGEPAFQVMYSDGVRANLKVLARRAREAGRHAFFLAALKALDRRLRSEPLSFGEILYTLKNASLEVRLGGEDFLMLRFGINVKERLVVVIDCQLIGDPGF